MIHDLPIQRYFEHFKSDNQRHERDDVRNQEYHHNPSHTNTTNTGNTANSFARAWRLYFDKINRIVVKDDIHECRCQQRCRGDAKNRYDHRYHGQPTDKFSRSCQCDIFRNKRFEWIEIGQPIHKPSIFGNIFIRHMNKRYSYQVWNTFRHQIEIVIILESNTIHYYGAEKSNLNRPTRCRWPCSGTAHWNPRNP